jgi:hypothetical protein
MFLQRVAFARWHVRSPPEFLEHRALALDDERVLDATAARSTAIPLRCAG